MAIGLKGHVLGPAFPEGYSNWQKTDLHDLIDADLIKEPTDKNVVKAIKKMAKEADELVIATDFDREGELIGLEALEEMLDANPALGTREDTAKAKEEMDEKPKPKGDEDAVAPPKKRTKPKRKPKPRKPTPPRAASNGAKAGTKG